MENDNIQNLQNLEEAEISSGLSFYLDEFYLFKHGFDPIEEVDDDLIKRRSEGKTITGFHFEEFDTTDYNNIVDTKVVIGKKMSLSGVISILGSNIEKYIEPEYLQQLEENSQFAVAFGEMDEIISLLELRKNDYTVDSYESLLEIIHKIKDIKMQNGVIYQNEISDLIKNLNLEKQRKISITDIEERTVSQTNSPDREKVSNIFKRWLTRVKEFFKNDK